MPALTSNASIAAFEKVMANRAAARNAVNVRGNPVKSRKNRATRKNRKNTRRNRKANRRN
jgi:hypothetical protein